MYKELRYVDADNQIIQAMRADGSRCIIEPDTPELWPLAMSGQLGKIKPYVEPPKPSADELLAEERASMVCTTVQLNYALLDAGVLGKAEAAFKAKPYALAIWSRAMRIQRRGPHIEALQTFLTDAEIDDIFRAAAAVDIYRD